MGGFGRPFCFEGIAGSAGGNPAAPHSDEPLVPSRNAIH
jgi:hypothetical protein